MKIYKENFFKLNLKNNNKKTTKRKWVDNLKNYYKEKTRYTDDALFLTVDYKPEKDLLLSLKKKLNSIKRLITFSLNDAKGNI